MSTLLPEQIESEQLETEKLESEQINFGHIKSWLIRIRSMFQSGTPKAILRLQYVWAGGILLILLSVSYGIVVVFFDKNTEFEENKKLSKDLNDLKEIFQNNVKDKEENSLSAQNLEERITQLETQVVEQSQL